MMMRGLFGSIRLSGLITFMSFSTYRRLSLNSPNVFTLRGVYTFPITSLKSSPPPSRKSDAMPV